MTFFQGKIFQIICGNPFDRAVKNKIVLRGAIFLKGREAMRKKIRRGSRVGVTALGILLSFLMTAVCGAQTRIPGEIYLYGEQIVSYSDLPGVVASGETAAFSLGASRVSLSLWGAVPIKTVTVTKTQQKTVLLSGQAVGIKAYTQGAVVVGVSAVSTRDGEKNPGKSAGIKEGDIITAVGQTAIRRVADFSALVRQGKPLACTVIRQGNTRTVTLTPVLSREEGCYRLGVWLRDSCAGIGTMTYLDPQTGAFAMLGHGIYDCDTGVLMPLRQGSVHPVTVTSVVRGTRGAAGELTGTFGTGTVGSLLQNQSCGVYGTVSADLTGIPVQVASRTQTECGDAQILCTVNDGQPRYYDCRITWLDRTCESGEKAMIVKVTDPTLLSLTGGIVQGMSGSPVVQNGKFVGAVTHVLVNDPTRGYCVFADTMLSAAQSAASEKLKEAS